jgi:hypothetical protein
MMPARSIDSAQKRMAADNSAEDADKTSPDSNPTTTPVNLAFQPFAKG